MCTAVNRVIACFLFASLHTKYSNNLQCVLTVVIIIDYFGVN